MSEAGITVSRTKRAKTEEELRKEREEAVRLAPLRAEQARKDRERKMKDRVLLSTYTTERDLTLAHEGQVIAIDIRIDHTEKILKQLERSLEQLRAEAAKLERSGKPITPNFESKIAKVERQMHNTSNMIEQRRLQKADIAAQFVEDRDRYRELKGLKKSN
jgi:mRNA deadenylase 3'-5' endonuclease subunit Ccr4